jgi:6-phosphogluconolactonase
VSAFKISETDGALTLINKQPTYGEDPCHVAIGPQGKHLFVSNYSSGSVAVYPIQYDGSIGGMCQYIQHEGSSINPARQAGPHAHALVFSPDGRFAFVPNLGIDRLMAYQMSGDIEPLKTATVPFFKTQPGAGPRHCVFSQDGKNCYLINELNSTISVLAYESERGSFSEVQVMSSLPDRLSIPSNTGADIHITPDGHFLYGSNRGHNSLAVYRIERKSGRLAHVDCQPCGGKTPRNFAIDPSGRFLICANQDSDNIVTFEIDRDTGLLTKRSEITVHTPVCVKMIT